METEKERLMLRSQHNCIAQGFQKNFFSVTDNGDGRHSTRNIRTPDLLIEIESENQRMVCIERGI